MQLSTFGRAAVLLGAFALAATVLALTLLRAEQLGYAGVQLALVVGVPAAFLTGSSIFGGALSRLAGRPARHPAAAGPARA